jgi:hypothetical protein
MERGKKKMAPPPAARNSGGQQKWIEGEMKEKRKRFGPDPQKGTNRRRVMGFAYRASGQTLPKVAQL